MSTARGRLLLLTRVRRHTGRAGPSPRQLRACASLPDAETYETLLARHGPRTAPPTNAPPSPCVPTRPNAPCRASELLRSPKSPALLERLFAAGRYHLLSAAGALPPRLTGLWTGDWDTAWSGAFTTNANLNLQIASAAAAALPEVSEAHAALVHGQLADWRDNARAIFGTRGIVAPSHTDGESGHTYHFQRDYPLHLWTAGADWLLQPLLEHAETRGVHDPWLTAALTEVAQFYEDFLTRHRRGRPPRRRPFVLTGEPPGERELGHDQRHHGHRGGPPRPAHGRRPTTRDPDASRWRALADRLPPLPRQRRRGARRVGLAGPARTRTTTGTSAISTRCGRSTRSTRTTPRSWRTPRTAHSNCAAPRTTPRTAICTTR